jgi:hypothetical protein
VSKIDFQQHTVLPITINITAEIDNWDDDKKIVKYTIPKDSLKDSGIV